MESRFTSSENKHRSSYGIGRTLAAVGGALVLIAANIALMVAIAPTSAADFIIWSYQAAPGAPWVGLILMSVLLSVGRMISYTSLGYDAFEPEKTTYAGSINEKMAALGLGATMIAFGLFGGAALSIVPPETRWVVIAISVAITAVVTLIVGGLELMTERSLGGPGRVLFGFGMFGGLIVLAVAYVAALLGAGFVDLIYLAAFGLILLGWLGDLVHEVAALTEDDRPILVNAYGLYAAVTGFLVHIIWIVAKHYADN